VTKGSAPSAAREASRLLSGYLCGTHSGLRAYGRDGRRGGSPDEIVALHKHLERPQRSSQLTLGSMRWRPSRGEEFLAATLDHVLAAREVIDLILYGSQARGALTGFSDVDAILVLEDAAAEDTAALRSLRPHVLAAQRAVLTYQPMQHHGFEVATRKLLGCASEALDLPASALAETRSLNGNSVEASFSDEQRESTKERLRRLAGAVQRPGQWPAHPWRTHGLIAMFELLPVVYLQACGVSVPKAMSFERARSEFRKSSWWPYDVLDEIRSVWPRTRHVAVENASRLVRNPWVAVAVWQRVRVPLPRPVAPLLSQQCLGALQELARTMLRSAG
jgi:hypothetical protein